MDRLTNIMRTGGNLGLGGFAPGVMVTVISIAGRRLELIPPAARTILDRVPLMVWGAGAGYAFALPGEDPTCAALKGAAGTVGTSVALASVGV
jgi:hypothetical protein